MKKIVDWINTHKKICFLIVVLAFFFPIFATIYLNYVIPSLFNDIGISADSLITYVAGFEAFVGTVFLGFIAVRQNDKANELNDLMVKNEEKHQKFERQPSVIITPLEVTSRTVKYVFGFMGPVYYWKNPDIIENYPASCWDCEYLFFSWSIKNPTLKQVRTQLLKLDVDFASDSRVLSFFNNQMNLFPSIPSIAPQESLSIGFVIDKEILESKKGAKGLLELGIINEANEEYKLKLLFIIPGNSENGCFLYKTNEVITAIER